MGRGKAKNTMQAGQQGKPRGNTEGPHNIQAHIRIYGAQHMLIGVRDTYGEILKFQISIN